MRLIQSFLWVAGAIIAFVAVAALGFWLRPLSYFAGMMYAREWFTGIESRYVTVSGHRIHYIAEGPANGQAVVLVHGIGGRGEDYLSLAPYLTNAGFRVYMPDLPGFGRSDKPAEFSYSIHDQASIVLGFLDVLGLKRVDLIGGSMGGWISQWVAADHPERVRRLILIDSAGIFEKPAWDPQLYTPTTPEQLDQLVTLVNSHPVKIPAFIARDLLRVSKENAWIIRRPLERALTGADRTEAILPLLKMPVLIVWGADDRVLPLHQGEKMHQLVPQSRFEVIPGCGHAPDKRCNEEIEAKVAEFERQ